MIAEGMCSKQAAASGRLMLLNYVQKCNQPSVVSVEFVDLIFARNTRRKSFKSLFWISAMLRVAGMHLS